MAICKLLKKCDRRTQILTLLLLFIGFQQFPVIYVGGSFKIYEMLGIIFLCLFGISWKKDIIVIPMFVFFVISPLISLIAFYVYDDVTLFYILFPVTKNTFRHNIYIFPILQVFFMIINYVILYNIYINRNIYKRFDLLIKWMVIIGTCIACYSIIAMFTGDPISHLPNFIQNKHIYDFRSSGLSQEPSSYILYQGWTVLLLWYSKKLFKKQTWVFMLIVNVMSLVLTFSSTLVLFVGVLTLMLFLFSRTYLKFVYVGAFVSLLWLGYITLAKYVDVEMLNYAMVEKVEHFIIGKEDAVGSGGFRHYESSLGWIIFKENPIVGVGVGNSTYFMHKADKESPIIPMGEQLTEKSFPPNTYSCVFAEQGIIGGFFFITLLLIILHKSWKYRNCKYGVLFLTGILFNIGCLLMIAPQYSMYLWVYMFLAMGYIRYSENTDKCIRYIKKCNRDICNENSH